MTLETQDLAIFNSHTSHLNATERAAVLSYIDDGRFSGLTFDTSIPTYEFNPSPALAPTDAFGNSDTSWEPDFTAAYRWGNWVGAGTGAGRLSDHSDFTTAEESVAALDVFDAIGRVHDLSIRDARKTLANSLQDANGNWLDEMAAVRAFAVERAGIDAAFINATETLGIRDGLTGYEADIRVLALEVMQFTEAGWNVRIGQIDTLVNIYQNGGASLQSSYETVYTPNTLYTAALSNEEMFGAGQAAYNTTPPIPVSAPTLDAFVSYWNTFLAASTASYNPLLSSPEAIARARLAFLSEFQAIHGSDATEQLVALMDQKCFAAGTPIQLWNGTSKPIEEITQSDVVLTYDVEGKPVPGAVDKLFTNTTAEFVRLSFTDGREDLVSTPGHRFLTETGDYMEIGHMLRLGGGTVRLTDTDGSIVEAKGEVIAYSAETAEMFEQSATKTIAFSGNTVLKEQASEGWTTYNFEVREHHNYVAGGTRVHNDSILSTLEAGDQLVSLNDDLTDMAVIRDGSLVVSDGYRLPGTDTQVEVELTFDLLPFQGDIEDVVAQIIEANPELASSPAAQFGPGNDLIDFVLSSGSFNPLPTGTYYGNPLTPAQVAILLVGDEIATTALFVTLIANFGTGSIGGTSGDDTLAGTSSDDVINGLAGDDLLQGLGGDDLIDGGEGDNTLEGGAGNDTLLAGSGADVFNGGDGEDWVSYADATEAVRFDIRGIASSNPGAAAGDTYISIENLEGSAFDDIMVGNDHVNQIFGGGGNDTLFGLGNEDLIHGGDGNDVMFGGTGGDNFDGGDGRDRIQYSQSTSGVRVDLQVDSFNNSEALNDTYVNVEDVLGSHHNDNIRGDAGANRLWGASGNDAIFGRQGNDALNGGAGNDYLDGGVGNDLLWGNAGADSFRFSINSDADRIVDFQDDVDTIQLRGFGLSSAADALGFASQVGSDVVFDFGGGDALTVDNTTLALLGDDILIV